MPGYQKTSDYRTTCDSQAWIGSDSCCWMCVQMPKFQDTRNNLHPRPWCVDDLDLLLDALTECQGAPFKKAVMFCDNSGSDIIMGTPTCRFNSLFPCSQHMHPS